MQRTLFAVAAVVAIAVGSTSALAQTNCQMIGGQFNCSNGLSGQRIGNHTFYNDGTSAQRIGNQTIFNNGTTVLRLGE